MNESSASNQTTLQGRFFDTPDDATRRRLAQWAFEYRGDVTLHLRDGRRVEGYVFDRRLDSNPPLIRLIETSTAQRLTIPLHDILAVAFTGKDTALGRRWEDWIRARQSAASNHPAGPSTS